MSKEIAIQVKRNSRRKFLASTAGVVAAPMVIPGSALGLNGLVAPSERIAMSFIGQGIRGTTHIKSFLPYKEVQVVAISDLFKSRRERSLALVKKQYGDSFKGCDLYPDFREMLARKDIDAVTVATPEHWHALTMVASMKAGKDVYGEKALTLTVAEGRAVVDTARRYCRVFQTGTQQRSYRNFRYACELARNGYLGEMTKVSVGVPGGHAVANSPTIPVPDDLDYNTWLGPSPVKPYNALRCTSPEGWYHMYDYCIGWIGSWGVHHLDIALWGEPRFTTGTLEIEGSAVFPTEGQGNTSMEWDITLKPKKGPELHFTDNTQNAQGCKFEGTGGWVHVNRSRITASHPSLLTVQLRPSDERLYESQNHHTNFLECIRSRRETVAPASGGHAATTVSIVADVATRLQRKVKWNWEKEQFENDPMANRMLVRAMRAPWRL